MPRSPLNRPRRASGTPTLELAPLVERTVRFLEHSPRGATRQDILAAMGVHPTTWSALREALEDSGFVVSVGRGPGLRHVHHRHREAIPEESIRVHEPIQRSQQLEEARLMLREFIRSSGEIDSRLAQGATGLTADPVRRLLLELVSEGRVERFGTKRSTRYRWVG